MKEIDISNIESFLRINNVLIKHYYQQIILE